VSGFCRGEDVSKGKTNRESLAAYAGQELTLPNQAKVAIVAALEREVPALVKQWKPVERDHDGRKYKFFENERAVLVCSGIGPEAARRATEAIIQLYAPVLVQSAGFAGALDPTLKAGTVLTPICVIDAKDGSRIEAGVGHWVLVSVDHPATVADKAKLAEAYWAHAVDMEAASVARAAQAHDITFVGLKAISDEANFEMPPMERFIASDGQFRTGAFVLYAAVRPWLWPRVIQLARNSSTAASALCEWLQQYNQDPEDLVDSEPDMHPTSEDPS
jgi:adenosylhomocysteine nucleosidase